MCATEQQENVSTVCITQLVFTVNAVRMEHGEMLLNSSVKVACPLTLVLLNGGQLSIKIYQSDSFGQYQSDLKVIGFALPRYTIGLKKLALIFHPVRSKTRTNHESFTHIFPHLPRFGFTTLLKTALNIHNKSNSLLARTTVLRIDPVSHMNICNDLTVILQR